jgi:UDP-2,3-diacylglucosamine pyrophosphatase LpxH
VQVRRLERAGNAPTVPAVPAPILYIAGDVHHDGSDPGFGRWLDRLATLPPVRLVLLGDVVEWWTDGPACRAKHEPILARLRAMRRSGWWIDILRGNRELAGGRAFEIACGCSRLHHPQLDIQLGPVHLRVVHGDRLMHDPAYRAWSVVGRSFFFRAHQMLYPPAALELVARMIRRSSRGSRPMTAKPSIFIDPRKVHGAARGCDVLVAGHVHQSWRRRLRGVDLILAGHWPPGRGHWVEGFADGRLERRSEAV